MIVAALIGAERGASVGVAGTAARLPNAAWPLVPSLRRTVPWPDLPSLERVMVTVPVHPSLQMIGTEIIR